MPIELFRDSEIRADGQCSLVSLERGRCAGTNISEHHLVWRSRGGGDEPENRHMICGRHHDMIHQENPQHGTDETGRYIQMDGERWYLLQDVEGFLETGTTSALKQLSAALSELNWSWWEIASALEWMDRHCAWWVVDCEDIQEFAREYGLGSTRRDTLMGWVRAERRRKQLPGDGPEVVKKIPEGRRVMEQAGAALVSLPSEQQRGVIDSLRGGGTTSSVLIDEIRALKGKQEEDPEPRWRVRGRAEIVLWESDVVGPRSATAAREKAESRWRGYKSVVGIDGLSTEAERIE